MTFLFKLLFVLVFFIVLVSLGIAMFYLTNDDEKGNKRMVNVLTLRVVLSFLLVGLLLFGFFTDLIQPNIR